MFAVALSVTVPMPVSDWPAVTVIQGALLVAVQPHPLPLVTADDPAPPAAAIVCDEGSIEYVHGGS